MALKTLPSVNRAEPIIADTAVAALRANMRGSVLRAGDGGYEAARQVWNGMIDKYPALIVRCVDAEDVATAITFASRHNLPLSVRGGGHNVAGYATNDDGLVIDLSLMRDVVVNPHARTVRVQGGALIADLDTATQQYGLAVPMGVVSETGVAGLTLNGGMGWLRRKYSLSCDHLIAADVVTADGRLIHVSETENSDLLWGLRGGGGNFGVVTSFEFSLVEVGPQVMFVGVMYPLELAPKLLPIWRDFMVTAPEAFTSQALFWTIPADEGFPPETHNRPVFIIVGLYSGEWQEGERLLQPLRELAEPVLDLSDPAPYTEVQTFYDPLFPAGELHYYWKSLDLDRLDDEVMAKVIEYAEKRASPHTLMVIWHQGGAMSHVPAEATAFGDRSAPYLLSFDSTWADSADSDVYTFGLEQVPGAKARLWTSDASVKMVANTKELAPGDAITVWWVIFNNPAACSSGVPDISTCGEPDLFNPDVQAEITYADGDLVKDNGRGRFSAQLYQGDTPRGWFGNGLIDPTGAEVHLVVRTHSQALSGRINDQILTFGGACNNVPPEHPGFGDGEPGPNHCEDIQFAVFQQ